MTMIWGHNEQGQVTLTMYPQAGQAGGSNPGAANPDTMAALFAGRRPSQVSRAQPQQRGEVADPRQDQQAVRMFGAIVVYASVMVGVLVVGILGSILQARGQSEGVRVAGKVMMIAGFTLGALACCCCYRFSAYQHEASQRELAQSPIAPAPKVDTAAPHASAPVSFAD